MSALRRLWDRISARIAYWFGDQWDEAAEDEQR